MSTAGRICPLWLVAVLVSVGCGPGRSDATCGSDAGVRACLLDTGHPGYRRISVERLQPFSPVHVELTGAKVDPGHGRTPHGEPWRADEKGRYPGSSKAGVVLPRASGEVTVTVVGTSSAGRPARIVFRLQR